MDELLRTRERAARAAGDGWSLYRFRVEALREGRADLAGFEPGDKVRCRKFLTSLEDGDHVMWVDGWQERKKDGVFSGHLQPIGSRPEKTIFRSGTKTERVLVLSFSSPQERRKEAEAGTRMEYMPFARAEDCKLVEVARPQEPVAEVGL